MFDTSSALNPSIQYQIDANYLEDGWRSYMAKAVRDKFHKPTIAIGNIRNPQVAEDILARGDADLIGMGRGLIADPDWCNKARYGHVEDIRKCISCNIGCVGNRIGGNKPLRCTVNPDLINGEAYKKHKVTKALQRRCCGRRHSRAGGSLHSRRGRLRRKRFLRSRITWADSPWRSPAFPPRSAWPTSRPT